MSSVPVWLQISGVAVILLGLMYFGLRQPKADSQIAAGEEEEDIASLIREATSVEELVDIAYENYFGIEDSEAFLAKIRPFENVLDEDDWRAVYLSAEQGSELQQLSHRHLRDS